MWCKLRDNYRDLFKSLIKAYYSGNFEEKVMSFLSESKMDKQELCKIISSLCGTNVDYSSNFIENLKKAIN